MRIPPYIPPRRLLFSGGGIRVVSYVGVLRALNEMQFLEHVHEFCGVSAGGLVALMLALGYKMSVLERFCFEYNFGNVRSVESENPFQILETFGIDSGENLERLIHKILHHKGFQPNATFQDLNASGRTKGLRLWASDIQFLKPVEFSANTTPTIPIVFALRASMCIPIYFIPLKHPDTNTYLVDGGVFDNYPIHYLTEQDARETLGIVFEHSKIPLQIHELPEFIGAVTSGYYRPSYQMLLDHHRCRTIILPCAEFSSLHFEASVQERETLVDIGYKATKAFFRTAQQSPFVKRRHSVS
jgi:predicted acylesterase/phospholipase RssA